MHQARFGVDADVRFHPEEILVSFLRLMHLRVAFTVLVLGRTRRVNDRRIDHRALTQHQTTVAQIAVDDLKNSARQFMFFQQATEIENRGFIGNPIQIQARELAQDRRFIQRFLHRRIAIAEPVLHQMNAQHGHQRIRRTAPLRPLDNAA